MKIALLNSVIMNGGDAGIVYGTCDAIYEALPSSEITIYTQLTKPATFCYPDLSLSPMLNDRWSDYRWIAKGMRVTYPLRTRIRFLAAGEKAFYNELKSMDAIVYCGGGYMNDLYGNRVLFAIMNDTLNLRIPHMAYAHSIGPFFKQESARAATALFNRFRAITVRDETSRQLLEAMSVSSLIRLTADAAFCMRPATWDTLVTEDREALDDILEFKDWGMGAPLLVMSVRDWLFPGRDNGESLRSQYRRELKRFITRVIESTPWRICFISTCQGRPGYGYDDSLFAHLLIQDLSEISNGRLKVCHHGFNPRAYPYIISKCADLALCMRMHFNIFSIMGGVPFLGIAYETKSLELAKQMGLVHLCHQLETLNSDDLFSSFLFAADHAAELRVLVAAGCAQLKERSLSNARLLASLC